MILFSMRYKKNRLGLEDVVGSGRKKSNRWPPNVNDGVRDVGAFVDVERPLNNASTIGLGVRSTPGKEKKDRI